MLLELSKIGESWTLLVDGIDSRSRSARESQPIRPESSPPPSIAPPVVVASLPQGVSFDTETGKYAANIRMGGRFRHLGNFDTPEQASKVYQEAKGGSN